MRPTSLCMALNLFLTIDAFLYAQEETPTIFGTITKIVGNTYHIYGREGKLRGFEVAPDDSLLITDRAIVKHKDQYRPAALKMSLHLGDEVETSDCRLEIGLRDGDRILINKWSRFKCEGTRNIQHLLGEIFYEIHGFFRHCSFAPIKIYDVDAYNLL